VGTVAAAHDAFRAAAVAGNPAGQFSWGLMLESEELRDLPGSLAEAARYYWLSARQGFALAQFQIAVMLEQGEAEADFDAAGQLVNAVSYYRAAGRQGLGLAWNNFAFCYLEGCGVEQNLPSARWYFREAIADGYVDHVDAEREIALLDARIAADQVLIAVPDSDSDSETRGFGLGYDFSCPVMFPTPSRPSRSPKTRS
jgi:TPR repeat protein